MDGDGLVFFLVVEVTDLFNDFPGLSFAFSGDGLDVFGVNANAIHDFCFLIFYRCALMNKFFLLSNASGDY